MYTKRSCHGIADGELNLSAITATSTKRANLLGSLGVPLCAVELQHALLVPLLPIERLALVRLPPHLVLLGITREYVSKWSKRAGRVHPGPGSGSRPS